MSRVWFAKAIKRVLLTLMVGLLTACASLMEQGVSHKSDLQIWVEGDRAFISGVLGADLPEKFTDLIRTSPNVQTIVLVDVPGSVDQEATINTARLIRRLGLNTHITRTGYVVSGGVDLFLGGVQRTIGAGAGVGVHSWLDRLGIDPDELNSSDPIHATYVNFYLAMGIPEDFYWFSLKAAPADRVYFLSPEEIYDYRLDTQ
ncbi:alpha/beta hydrolase [Marinomonas agarivorans]|nr:alpha/beta hydrolase [Marinomonas agarivorans]